MHSVAKVSDGPRLDRRQFRWKETINANLHRPILWSLIVPEEEMRNPWYDYGALCNNSFKHFTSIQIQCYCTAKSMHRNLWRQLKWGFLHGERVGKKYCKTPFFYTIDIDTEPLFLLLQRQKIGRDLENPCDILGNIWKALQYMKNSSLA